MRVEVTHVLGEEEAVRRLDALVEDLVARDYKGVADIKLPQRAWTGNQLAFSFTVAKGFFEVPIRGHMTASDRQVVVDAELPGMLTAFVGEERIRRVVQQELGKVLSA